MTRTSSTMWTRRSALRMSRARFSSGVICAIFFLLTGDSCSLGGLPRGGERGLEPRPRDLALDPETADLDARAAEEVETRPPGERREDGRPAPLGAVEGP